MFFGVGKTSHETKKPSSKLYGPKISRKLTRENSLHPNIDWLLSRLGLQEIPQNDFITRNRKSLSTVWKLMKHAKTISYFNKVSCIVNCISTLARCERFTVGSSVRLTYRSVLQCYIGPGHAFPGGKKKNLAWNSIENLAQISRCFPAR